MHIIPLEAGEGESPPRLGKTVGSTAKNSLIAIYLTQEELANSMAQEDKLLASNHKSTGIRLK